MSIRPTLKATTWNGYRSKVRNHVVPYIGGMRLNRVDGGTLNELYAQLLEGGRRKSSRTGKGYSPDVVARAQELRAEGLSLQATADQPPGRVRRGEPHHQGHARVPAPATGRLPGRPDRSSTNRRPSTRAP